VDTPQTATVAVLLPHTALSWLGYLLSKPLSFASSRVLVCVYKLAGMSEIRIGWPCKAGALAVPTLL